MKDQVTGNRYLQWCSQSLSLKPTDTENAPPRPLAALGTL